MFITSVLLLALLGSLNRGGAGLNDRVV